MGYSATSAGLSQQKTAKVSHSIQVCRASNVCFNRSETLEKLPIQDAFAVLRHIPEKCSLGQTRLDHRKLCGSD